MPSQQRFEGPDLEQLLGEVRDRFGTDVPIVEANRIRKGGVGGFFAREVFEVVVEADDAGIDLPIGTDPADTVAPLAAAATTPRPRTLLDLVDAVDDGPTPAEATAPTGTSLSTDGAAFAAVLERIARATQEQEGRDRGDAGHPAHDRPVDPEEDAPFRSFRDAPPTAPAPAPAPEPVDAAPAPAPAPGSRPRPAAAPAPRRSPARSSAAARPLDVSALTGLGFPDALLRSADLRVDRLHALVELAERFPRPRRLPETGDTVIALVGDRAGMHRASAWINERLGLAPDRLMLATRTDAGVFPAHRRIATSEEAIARRGAWRRAPRPVLVAVDAPIGMGATTWGRHVLDALEPSAVWAVVDAHRKPEDVVAWAERIGGVDAVVLEGTQDTSSPASILSTGLPVSLIDGRLATPSRWAAVLDERLEAAAA